MVLRSIVHAIVFVAASLAFAHPISAQIKFEREFEIEERAVPSGAVRFIASLEPKQKIKWYREESATGSSVEAKFRFQGRNYSIEFDRTGKLEDAEYVISEKEIEAVARKNIHESLTDAFVNWRIDKVQMQLLGSEEAVREAMLNGNFTELERIGYEIVLTGKENVQSEAYEFNFSETGALLNRKIIVQRNTDHLEY